MTRTVSWLALSIGLHAALAFALWPAVPQAHMPRLGLKTVNVRLLPAPGEAMVAATSGSSAGRAPATGLRHAGSPVQRAAQPDDWLPSGKLTRLPVPLDPLDLDTALAGGFAGRVELIVLVDRLGQVREVKTRERNAGAVAFANALTPRLRSTRFAPGEVDGVAVNAVVKISVVSETTPVPSKSAPPSSI